jgi:hypothetical protein
VNLVARSAHCAALVALLPAFAPMKSFADASSAPSPSPTPQPPSPYVQLEEEISPDYTSESGSSTVLNVSGQTLIGDNGALLRLKLPIVTSAPAESVTGAGDLALTALRFFNTYTTNELAGVTIRIPTAQNSSLGSDKYSIGPAFGYSFQTGLWRLGFYSQSYFSVIGPSWRAPVGKSKIEPIVSLSLPNGWGVGFSSMSITYDWVLNKWTEVPIGGRISKRFGRFGRLGAIGVLLPLEATLEAEKNLSRVADTPGWTTRISLRWTL